MLIFENDTLGFLIFSKISLAASIAKSYWYTSINNLSYRISGSYSVILYCQFCSLLIRDNLSRWLCIIRRILRYPRIHARRDWVYTQLTRTFRSNSDTAQTTICHVRDTRVPDKRDRTRGVFYNEWALRSSWNRNSKLRRLTRNILLWRRSLDRSEKHPFSVHKDTKSIRLRGVFSPFL